KEEMNALGNLDAYGLINKRQADSSLDVHRLVHLVTRNAVTRPDDLFPYQKHENRSVWRKYLAHAQFALNSPLIDQERKRRIDLAWTVGNCLDSDGRWKEAETFLVQVMGFRRKVLGPNNPDTLTSMNNLPGLYQNQGKYEAAKPLYEETLQLSKKVLCLEHPETLTNI
ncbi:hypothetical protein BKA61DRAFT_457880, partial [Leptodontidium sp. MPI-SDFR-AT-0119]